MTLSTTESGAGGLDLSTATPPASPYEKAQVEYKAQLDALIKQQNNLVASLDSRQSAGNPFFALAQGFLAPTKGGGFGESAGNAMQLFGAQQEQERKLNQETAMMRMQLAQASLAPAKEIYVMGREKAMGEELIAQLGGAAGGAGRSGATAGGTDVGNAAGASGVTGGGGAGIFSGMPDSVRQRIISRAKFDQAGASELLDKWLLEHEKVPEKVKEAKGFAALLNDRNATLKDFAAATLANPTIANQSALAKIVFDKVKTIGDLSNTIKGLPPELADTVKQALNMVQELSVQQGSTLKPNDAQGAPIGNKFEGTREQALREVNDPTNAGMNPTDRKNVIDAINDYFNRRPPVSTGAPTAVGAGPSPAVGVGSNPALSMQAQEDVEKKRRELEVQTEQKAIQDRQALMEKPWEQHRSDIFGWTPTVNKNGIRDLDELANIASISPNVFNLLRGSGWWTALQAAAQEGAQAGKLGSFSLPTEKYIETKNLNPQEKINLNRAAKILANQFFENAKQNKSVLGPSISNSDTVLLRAPVATPSDPAASVIYWAKEHSLFYKQRQELYNALHDWDEKVGPKKPLGMFFNSPQYNEISDKYNYYLNELRQKYSPVR